MNVGLEYTPVGEAAAKVGVLSVLAATLIGVGSLVAYVVAPAPQPNALDLINSGRWSEAAKQSIQNTYAYLFVSVYAWIVSSAYVFHHPSLFWAFSSLAMVAVDFFVQILVQSGRTFALLSNEGRLSPQRAAWFAYCLFLGGTTSPAFLYGTETVRIAFHLTYVAMLLLVVLSLTAPAGKYAAWQQSLSGFEAAVFVGSIGSALFPPTTTIGAVFFSVSFYGGLILFSAYFLCHSQQAQLAAQETAEEGGYSAVAKSVPMLLDVVSIFTRIVVMVPPK